MLRVMMSGLIASLVLGCAPDLVPGRYGCETDSECPDEWVCGFDERCYPRGQDPDGGTPMLDAGPDPVDAGPDPVDGGPDTGPPCEPRPVNVDLLLMIDQSGSMAQAQQLLREALGPFIEALAAGDLNQDGIRDFPAVESLQIGVITSDLGDYGAGNATCSPMGDDGVLLTEHRGDVSGCAPSGYAPVQEYVRGEPRDVFVNNVECLSTVGINGCGYEQQLDAVLKSLTPSESTIEFHNGLAGHGTVANAGFLRDDSVLVTLLVTDEDDCSTHNAELFDRDRLEFGALNQRCFNNPSELLPTSRFSAGLLALRDAPEDLIFAGIIGAPSTAPLLTPAQLLADPAMSQSWPEGQGRMTPACMRAGVQGDPGRRYVQVAQEIDAAGGNVTIHSICEPSFSGVSIALLQRLAPRLRARSCEPEPME
ncbi:MAG: hypothetical protein AB8I08_01410 [Sandaracinaceae bacterium]